MRSRVDRVYQYLRLPSLVPLTRFDSTHCSTNGSSDLVSLAASNPQVLRSEVNIAMRRGESEENTGLSVSRRRLECTAANSTTRVLWFPKMWRGLDRQLATAHDNQGSDSNPMLLDDGRPTSPKPRSDSANAGIASRVGEPEPAEHPSR
jgi:hypothetical protein